MEVFLRVIVDCGEKEAARIREVVNSQSQVNIYLGGDGDDEELLDGLIIEWQPR